MKKKMVLRNHDGDQGIGTHSYLLNICPSDNHPVTKERKMVEIKKYLRKLNKIPIGEKLKY
jgi:hypothetical protein